MSVLEELLAGVATYMGAVPGIATAIYPPPDTITQPPTAIVYGNELHIGGGQEFIITGRVRVGLYMGTIRAQDAIGRADRLIEPIIDQFAANNHGYHLDGTITSGNVDRCTVSDVQLSQILPYAGQDYLGGLVFLDIKYRRFAGGGYEIS